MAAPHWEEDEAQEAVAAPSDAADLIFALSGAASIPVDHAHALSRAVVAALPWLPGVENAGIHLIHGADSGNGWQRPEGEEAELHLARRTRLKLRLPRAYLAQGSRLSGKVLDVSARRLVIGAATARPLGPATALYAHHVVDDGREEPVFLEWVADTFRDLGLNCRKILCGKAHRLALPGGWLETRSLMAADLSPADSLTLQCRGLGPQRLLGCGLFVPHKGVRRIAS